MYCRQEKKVRVCMALVCCTPPLYIDGRGAEGGWGWRLVRVGERKKRDWRSKFLSASERVVAPNFLQHESVRYKAAVATHTPIFK